MSYNTTPSFAFPTPPINYNELIHACLGINQIVVEGRGFNKWMTRRLIFFYRYIEHKTSKVQGGVCEHI